MKTLVTILNYNTPDLTDRLYEQLSPYKSNQYDLVVLDNGSSENGMSGYTKIKLTNNVYFGGGLNVAFKIILDNPQYDSLMFLNSDLILHGYNLISTLRNVMITGDYKLLSPCVLEPNSTQCHWKTMHCWNSNLVRDVKWIDFQCPLIHRDVIEKIKQFDGDLIFGWGNDVYTGIICEENNWKVGVVDYIPVIHLSGETIKRTNKSDYNKNAMYGMVNYFTKINKMDKLKEMREYAESYVYEK
jgi:GT2 family glycosyltransferase